MAYCFMSIEKIKTSAGFSRKQAHNLREGFVPNADISRTFMNEELIKPKVGNSFNQTYKQRVKESEFYKTHKVRKDAVKGLEIMCTYGLGKNEKMPDEFTLDKWKEENIAWLKKTFGEENVISVVLHMDEVTPHLHAIVVPMVDQQLNATQYIGKKSRLSHLQDTYAEQMKSVGLRRGLKHSCAKHTDIRKFYADLNNELKKELPHTKDKETAEEYRQRANEVYQQSNVAHFREIKEYERKLAEHNTYDLQDVINFENEKKQLHQEKEEFEKERDLFEEKYHASPETTCKALDKLQELKESFQFYEDQHYAKAVLDGLNEIERYYQENYKEKEKYKKVEYNKDTNDFDFIK